MSDTALIVAEPAKPNGIDMGIMRVATPAEVLAVGAEIATPLAKFIKDRNLSVRLGNKDYVVVEAWNTLGMMMGVTPHEVGVEEKDGIFTAKVELRRISDGKAMASASAECGSEDEKDKWGKPTWSNRPRYARRSMAITRATAKAGRMAFGWVMTLAGYQTTPAEEMQPLHDAGIIEAEAKVVPPPVKAAPVVAPESHIPFDDEPEPARDEPPEGFTLITKVSKRTGPKKDGTTYSQWFITTADGREGSTFDGQLAVAAEAAMASKTFVLVTFETRGKYTNLVSIVRA